MSSEPSEQPADASVIAGLQGSSGDAASLETVVSVEEMAVIDENGVLVQVNSDDLTGGLQFYMENNSDRNISVEVKAMAVNGVMYDNPYLYDSIPIDKKATSILYFDQDWLENSGIDLVKQIDVCVWVYDQDAYENFGYLWFDSGISSIPTSGYTGPISRTLTSSAVLVNDDIAVVPREFRPNEITFTVFNSSDRLFTFDLENASVNDWAYDTFIQVYNEYLFPGCATECTVSVDDDFLAKTGITSIETFEFALCVQPDREYDQQYTTEPIVLENH